MRRGILTLALSAIILLTSSCTSSQVSLTTDVLTCGVKATVTFVHPTNEYVGLVFAIADQVVGIDGCISLGRTILSSGQIGQTARSASTVAALAAGFRQKQGGATSQLTIFDGTQQTAVAVDAGPVYLTNCSWTASSTSNFQLTAPWFIDVDGTAYTSLAAADVGTDAAAVVAQRVITAKHQVFAALIGELSTDTYQLTAGDLPPGMTAIIYPKLVATFVVGAYYIGPDSNPPAGARLPHWAYLSSIDVGTAYQRTQYVVGDPLHLCPLG